MLNNYWYYNDVLYYHELPLNIHCKGIKINRIRKVIAHLRTCKHLIESYLLYIRREYNMM